MLPSSASTCSGDSGSGSAATCQEGCNSDNDEAFQGAIDSFEGQAKRDQRGE